MTPRLNGEPTGRTDAPDVCPTCSATQALLDALAAMNTGETDGEVTEHHQRAIRNANERWDSLPKRRPHTCRWAPKVEHAKPVEP